MKANIKWNYLWIALGLSVPSLLCALFIYATNSGFFTPALLFAPLLIAGAIYFCMFIANLFVHIFLPAETLKRQSDLGWNGILIAAVIIGSILIQKVFFNA